MRRHHILIPLAALLATLPLILHGCSCGHDFDFHLQSWLDAAYQFRHGTLYPHWAFSPAWNAGEPRFLFYPPLSWLLGAILTLIFPIAATPAIFTFIALTAAGFSMHRLASRFASPNAALLAATLYLANPYMLFNAFERTAYAELLAAAWIPLLILAALRKRPTIPGIAIPFALLWLTNAPAAVMGSYAFAVLAIIRLLHCTIETRKIRSTLPPNTVISTGAQRSGEIPVSPLRLATTYLAGATLGLTLPAFYLIPAAYERRFVQIAMAIIPNMRIQDNFLFGHTADAPHNTVLHTASLLGVTLLALTFITLLTLLAARRKGNQPPAFAFLSVIPAGNLLFPLAALTLLIAFLLTPISTPIWLHLPELSFLQFPWRLLTILSAILTFTIALLFNRSPTPKPWALSPGPWTLLLPLALTLLCIHLYRQPCDDTDVPAAVAQSFTTHHGIIPTDEYTPNNADNDAIRPNNPSYWLSTNPDAFAPNTTPNPGATDLTFDGSFPPSETLSNSAPHHLTLNLPQPETLILNLRDFPAWRVTRNSTEIPSHLQRDDGLLAIPLPAGPSILDITWHRTLDQQLGLALSCLALILLTVTVKLDRKSPSVAP
jgi:hypothetical protein